MPAVTESIPSLSRALETHQTDIMNVWVALIQKLPFVSTRALPTETISLWARDFLNVLIEIAQLQEDLPPFSSPSSMESIQLAGFHNHLEVGELVEALLLGKEAIYPYWVDRGDHPSQAQALRMLDQVVRRAAHRFSQAYAVHYQRLEKQAIREERSRLAREFHDSVAQSLYSVSLYVEAALRAFQTGNAEGAMQYLHEVSSTSQEALREMRLLIFDLRPPLVEQEGLISALQARLEAVESRAGFKTTLVAEGQPDLPLPVQEELYRVVQEALNNALKHAHAQHVTVKLCFSKHAAWLEVDDDGVGFDPVHTQGGLGLKGIEERIARLGGTLTIESAPNQGARVKVALTTTESLISPCEEPD